MMRTKRWPLLFLLLCTSTYAIPDELTCGKAEHWRLHRDTELRWMTSEQMKYDALYYALDIELIPDSNLTRGTYLTRLVITDSSMTEVQLDYSSLPGIRSISELWLNETSSEFTHENDLLVVPLTTGMTMGDTLEIRISSVTGPEPGCSNCSFNWDHEYGEDLIWSNSQPYDARDWWPSKDYPMDKPDSMDIRITVPDELVVASNGILRSVVEIGDGRSTWHWHEGYPIATYLVSLAIYPYFVWYDEYVSADGDTLPIEFYTFLDTLNSEPDYLVENYRMLPEMLALFEELFGPYPFPDEKYGHAEWGAGYGMEHQTLTSMGDPTERRVAHELAHMWWGDMITLETYHHIWLNEGFARYAEALWWEHSRGPSGYHQKMGDHEYYGAGTIYVEDPDNDNIFHFNLSYNKASWVLHMLRHVVGDSTFFDILRAYGATPEFAYATATTEQFRDICEDVSGMELEPFFEQWIYGSGYPNYLARWFQHDDTLEVEVIQQGIVFDMPVDLVVYTADTLFWTVLQIDEDRESFFVDLPSTAEVTTIGLDPYEWILKNVQIVVGVDEEGFWPTAFNLEQNFPNPFNAGTLLRFNTGGDPGVSLLIHDITGSLVRSLKPGSGSGIQELIWDGLSDSGAELPAGIYMITLSSPVESRTIKTLMIE